MSTHYELGKKGEQIAIDYLVEKKYEVLEHNWRYQKAEIDIIAKKGNILIAVEVKTRTTGNFGDPQHFVNPKKIKLMVMAMNSYVFQKELDIEVRFDIIAIIKNEVATSIEHLEYAFLFF
ncbi:MAG: YraN family protein [Flavobacteriaceae bacterium]|nr:MAG: YraN family protein [Flavobacteriaceae bacterium]